MEFRNSEGLRTLLENSQRLTKLLQELDTFSAASSISRGRAFLSQNEGNEIVCRPVAAYEGKMIIHSTIIFPRRLLSWLRKKSAEELLRKEIFRLAQFVRDSEAKNSKASLFRQKG